ncbi:MAG: response regulator [Myxococcaceae bacterium]|nr:response regulator [Myxococcaceae bacterium]MCA3015420.1 response regulator [Myxococcaceae bacterium]
MFSVGKDAPGLSEDEGRELLRAVLLWSMGTTLVVTFVGVVSSGQYGALAGLLAPIPLQAVALLALRRLPVRLVAAVYFAVVSLVFAAGALLDRGTSGQAYYGLVLVVQVTAMLFGTRGVGVLFPLLLGLGLGLAALEANGGLPAPLSRTPYEALLAPVSAFVLTAAGSLVLHRSLARTLQQARTQALVTAKANTQLSHEIERRVSVEKALQASMEKALEASRLKSSFLANMSHELRTPMNAVVGLTDLLLREAASPKQVEALETIRGSSEVLLRLLDDLLDLTKIESGAMVFEALPTSPAQLAEEVRKLFQQPAQAKGLALRLTVDAGVPEAVLMDPTRLRQVLVNLVGNAVKFTEAGEVSLGVAWVDGQLIVLVRDTGIGISPDQQARLFQPFVQGDASTTRRFGGTGLGLAIVKRLVDAQGGQVEVAGAEGRGSAFTVTLPAPRTSERARGSSGRLGEVPAGGFGALTVLLAEDNPINERVAKRLLEHLGVKASVARNGREAVEAVERGRFDLVLMDMQMPELDGLEATRAVKARHGAAVRVVAMTANAMPEDKARAKEAGCDDFLAKPVRLDDLERVLSRAKPGA